MTSEHLAVAALILRADAVLLARRGENREWYPGVWELPGGHVKAGETPRAAVVRELHEELGISVEPESEPWRDLVNREARVSVWVIEAWEGALINQAPDEHDRLAWVVRRASGMISPPSPLGPLATHLLG